MTDLSHAQRFAKVADTFGETVRAVPDDAWDRPAPCEGWVARDVVGHLVEWVPGFFVSFAELDLGPMPSVDDDPAAAWAALDAAPRAALADPEVATPRVRHARRPPHRRVRGRARSTHPTSSSTRGTSPAPPGSTRPSTPTRCTRCSSAMEPMDEMLRGSGQFGARVPVPDDADEQTKLIAFTGRQP